MSEPKGGGIKRTFYAGLAALLLALEEWQLTKAQWLADAARWANDKARGRR